MKMVRFDDNWSNVAFFQPEDPSHADAWVNYLKRCVKTEVGWYLEKGVFHLWHRGDWESRQELLVFIKENMRYARHIHNIQIIEELEAA